MPTLFDLLGKAEGVAVAVLVVVFVVPAGMLVVLLLLPSPAAAAAAAAAPLFPPLPVMENIFRGLLLLLAAVADVLVGV